MSWLYSIVFAGLLFSSNGESPVNKAEVNNNPPPVEATLKDEIEKFEQSYPLNANGRVSVSNVNGSIVVEAWDRNEVKLEATKIADTKEALADVEIKVDSRADYFSVEADYGDWKRNGNRGWKNRGKLEVEFRLSVPRTAVLNEIETVNGSVSVSNFTNYTKISAVNGNVTATNLRGAANCSTVNGEVVADFDQLASSSKINLSTVNGRVNLTIPSDANATIKADSLNGAITNDFGLPVRKGEYVGRDLYGRVGTGDVQIKLDSVNGRLTIAKKNDGKSTNPATNLLPQKGKDEDWDEDNDEDKDDERGSAQSVKINKEVARSVRDAQKHTEKGLKEARKAMAEIKLKDLEKIKIDTEALQESVKAGLMAQQAALAHLDANWAFGTPVLNKKTNSFAVKGTPKVVVDAKGCGVKVRGWDRPEVKYVVTTLSNRGRSHIDVEETNTDSSVTLKVVSNGTPKVKIDAPDEEDIMEFATRKDIETININEKKAVVKLKNGKIEKYDLNDPDQKRTFESKYGKHSRSPSPSVSSSQSSSTSTDPAFPRNFRWDFSMFGGENDVRIEVFVPKKSNLKIITDGEIRLDGVSGDIEVSGENEAINIRDVDGKLRLAAAEAQVRLIGFRGELDSKTECGNVYLEGDFDKLSASATEGTIFLTMPESSNASFVSNTDIETEGFKSAGETGRTWRLGKGGTRYNFNFTEGKLVVRNAALMNSY